MTKLILGDSAKVLKKVEHNSIDLIVTDPPYGYAFMGKSWDRVLPDIEIFRQCFRVLKPGAFAFVMSAPRSDVLYRMMQRLEESGFEIAFTPIFWTYATGFPKATNVGKTVDKKFGAERKVVGFDERSKGIRPGSHHIVGDIGYEAGHEITAPVSDEAKALDGSYAGFQPKPAVEVIIVAMKPLSEKGYVEQAMVNQKGVTWLDDCRIPYCPSDKPDVGGRHNIEGRRIGAGDSEYGFKSLEYAQVNLKGRFPANLLVSDDVLNDGSDHKSGELKAGTIEHDNKGGVTYGEYKGREVEQTKASDSGSFSRYFDLDAWAKTFPFLVVSKASRSERDKGLDELETQDFTLGPMAGRGEPGQKCRKCGHWKNSGSPCRCVEPDFEQVPFKREKVKNFHPTVKPLKLMAYLIILGSRKGDLILDPFNGSGTTGVAAKELGRDYLGVEIMPPYLEISKARIGECEVVTDTEWEFKPWMKEEMEKLGLDVSKYQLQMVTGVKEVEEAKEEQSVTESKAATSVTLSKPEISTPPLDSQPSKSKYRLVMKNGKYVMVKE